jgi:hypothetical protein
VHPPRNGREGRRCGAGVFFGTLPLTFFTGTSTESAYVFFLAPARFSVARRLGDYRN